MQTGTLLIQAWKAKSLTFFEYKELAEKLNLEGKDGKTIARRKYIPIEEYLKTAYSKYIELCIYLQKEPLKLGAWLRS